MGGTIRFRDLGPLVLDRDGTPLPVGGARLVAALGLLLVHAGRPVSVDALAEAMWAGQATPRSASTLDSHVWRLRRLLEPDRGRGAPAELLLRDGGGYRLLAMTDQVDSMRFARLADETVDLLTAGQPERALRRADEAVALWRGRPFAPHSDEPWARPAVARLEELHGQVRERRIEALLAVGDPERALVELEPAIAAEPLRERLWAHRMLAAYRCGRTERALATYRDVRELLLEELGVEPGPELRDLHGRILADDPALLGPARPVGEPARPPAPDRAVEIHLPVRHTRLIGRDTERDRLAELLAAHPLVTIVGTAGCGKTRLSIEVARAAADGFPDGVWAVDLTTVQSGDQVLPTITSALGLAAPVAGTFTDALRTFTRGRRMLLLLDNCEHVLDDVAALVDVLLVEGTELAVLGTSREPLDVDGEVVWGLAPLPLPDADERDSPAVTLFLERLDAADRTAGAAARDDPACRELAVRICRAVDGVPLAMELAAARARAFTLDEIAQQVGLDPSALARVGRARPEQRRGDHHRTVRFAVEQSYRMLPPDEAALHRAVSVVPGPFTPGLAGALADMPAGDTRELLARLVHRSLLATVTPAGPGRPTRFTQLATVRGHAAHAVHAAGGSTGGAGELSARRDRWVEDLVTAHPRLGRPEEVGWFAALDDDLVALRATLHRNLVDAPSACGVRIASRLGLYWYYRGMMVEARHWQERAAAVTDGAPLDRALVRYMLGGALAMGGRSDLGLPLIADGHAAVAGTPDERSPLRGEVLAVLSGALFVAEQADAGRTNAALVRSVAAATPDGSVDLLADLSALLSTAGTADPERVMDQADAVHDAAVAAGNTFVAWMASEAAVNAALTSGDVGSGLRWSDRMIVAHQALRVREGPTLLELRADLLALAGDGPAAVRLFAAARAHNQRAGMRWPNREITAGLMARATAELDRVEFEDAWQEGSRLTLDDLGAAVAGRAPLHPG